MGVEPMLVLPVFHSHLGFSEDTSSLSQNSYEKTMLTFSLKKLFSFYIFKVEKSRNILKFGDIYINMEMQPE